MVRGGVRKRRVCFVGEGEEILVRRMVEVAVVMIERVCGGVD